MNKLDDTIEKVIDQTKDELEEIVDRIITDFMKEFAMFLQDEYISFKYKKLRMATEIFIPQMLTNRTSMMATAKDHMSQSLHKSGRLKKVSEILKELAPYQSLAQEEDK